VQSTFGDIYIRQGGHHVGIGPHGPHILVINEPEFSPSSLSSIGRCTATVCVFRLGRRL